jgi:hypothetical protein
MRVTDTMVTRHFYPVTSDLTILIMEIIMGSYTEDSSSFNPAVTDVNLVCHEIAIPNDEAKKLRKSKSVSDFAKFHDLALESGNTCISKVTGMNLNEGSLDKLWTDCFANFCTKQLLTEDHIVTDKRIKWYMVYTLETESGVVLDTSKVSLNHLISDLSLRRNS